MPTIPLWSFSLVLPDPDNGSANNGHAHPTRCRLLLADLPVAPIAPRQWEPAFFVARLQRHPGSSTGVVTARAPDARTWSGKISLCLRSSANGLEKRN